MTDIEKTSYDILWYLNEYPEEINATDDVIIGSLKIDRHDYQKAKRILLNDGFIKQNGDNKNNVAWELTDEGRLYFNKLKTESKQENAEAFNKDEQIKDLTITLYQIQIGNEKRADIKMYKGLFIGAILSVGGGLLLEMSKKTPKDKEEIIQVHVSTHNAAIDSVFVRTDTIPKK